MIISGGVSNNSIEPLGMVSHTAHSFPSTVEKWGRSSEMP